MLLDKISITSSAAVFALLVVKVEEVSTGMLVLALVGHEDVVAAGVVHEEPSSV